MLCAHGRVGQTQLPFWRRISQSEIRNSAAAEKNWNRKARAGKNSFPPTPFLFARPSNWILKLGIRIFVKKCSNFVQKTPPKLNTEEKNASCWAPSGIRRAKCLASPAPKGNPILSPKKLKLMLLKRHQCSL